MMKIVIEGVLSQDLPWLLVGIGALIAILTEIAGIPSLAFAVGIYLPLATMSAVFVGGFIRWMAERKARNENERRNRRERGILFGSGLVGGEGLLGVGIATYAVLDRPGTGGHRKRMGGVAGAVGAGDSLRLPDLDAVASDAGSFYRIDRPQAVGLMFWFIWKKLVGSYLFFSSTRRW